MSEENKDTVLSHKTDSIFSQPIQQTGYFENPQTEKETAPSEAAAQPDKPAPAPNPFSTGTDAPVLPKEDSSPPQENRDARVRITVDATHLTAEAFAEEPAGNGKPLSKEMLEEALNKAGVVFGLKEKAMAELLAPTYEASLVVARGIPPRDGEDGICKELYPRVSEAKVTEKENGNVDYKELGLINDLPAGSVICEVYPPSEGVPGTDVYGKELKPRSGKKSVPPIGEGTRMSEDGRKVVTTLGGNLVFRVGRFCVDSIYRVQDITYDVGNIAFSGEVQVTGDMLDGFEIHAGKDITLHGRVGNAVLDSKAHIKIEQGINGTGKAEVIAGQNLTAGFIENCIVRVGGNITAGSIINSTVECEGDIDVTSKHGIICGGKVTAFGSIHAKEIGNETNSPTHVTVGITPKLLKDRKKYVDQLAEVDKHIDEMSKNMQYIEKLIEQQREIPQERVQLLQRTKLTLPITERKRDQLAAAIAEIEEKMESSTGSTISAKIINPPTRITIGKLNLTITETKSNARIYINSAGELTVGSL